MLADAPDRPLRFIITPERFDPASVMRVGPASVRGVEAAHAIKRDVLAIANARNAKAGLG